MWNDLISQNFIADSLLSINKNHGKTSTWFDQNEEQIQNLKEILMISVYWLNLRSNKTEFNAFYQRTVVARFKKFGRSKQAKKLFNVQ